MDSDESVVRSRWQRAPVMIVGAHRSGTTATAGALEILGLQIGQRLDSHHESKALQRLHENYLERVGAAWHRPAPFLEWAQTAEGERDCVDYLRDCAGHEFGRIFGYRKNLRGVSFLIRLKLGGAWGWKEPRTTLFAPFWLQLFPQARVIDVVRHPLTVAMSIRRREMNFRAAGNAATPHLDEVDYCLGLALIYVQSGERLANQTPYYRRVRFEDIQANPRKTLVELADFCGLSPSRDSVAKAAATIRPQGARRSDGLSETEARELLSHYPVVAELGYKI